MKKEKIVLSFIAVAVGLIFAGGAFYFYQTTKTLPDSKQKTVTVKNPSPTPEETIFLTISEPSDEAVFDKKIVNVIGKTKTDATIIIVTKSDQQVIKPTAIGSFSTTVNIENGQNIIRVTAISANGEEKTVEKVVTFSTEEF